MPGTYISPAETGFYLTGTRYYDPEIGRFINADKVIAGVGGDINGCNLYSYCFNNPINMSDLTGDWPKWVETVAKVVSVVAVVAAVAVTVTAVSAFTAGTGSAAAVYGASIFLGAALSGINGAVANSNKGNSYANGYVGGATGGGIQAACSKTTGGVVLGGGAGVTIGTAITDTLNNWDPDSKKTTKDQMIKNATTSGLKALVTSSITAYVGYAADLAKIDGAGGLMPNFTYGFAEGFKAFFGWADDAVIYVWE